MTKDSWTKDKQYLRLSKCMIWLKIAQKSKAYRHPGGMIVEIHFKGSVAGR
ncbi:hypothetical protein [[Phormidium] sp. ETS-05]|uniref:hypothetical protein n=1 Tax=[Phormidium] sp. ETS-05 TaxID=222819 RepID=UPI0018EEE49A|nr:hypothetical protein [[Phormidium] sp. ETS-05]